MPSEYEPISIFRRIRREDHEDSAVVGKWFRKAGAPYLSSPLPWFVWGTILPTAALATRTALSRGGLRGALFLWSIAIIVGGLVEARAMRKAGAGGSGVARWALRAQANLSVVGLALSLILIWRGEADLLAGLWLLILGYSFYSLGGLSYSRLQRYGLTYQLGGFGALFFARHGLLILAATTALANFILGASIWLDREE